MIKVRKYKAGGWELDVIVNNPDGTRFRRVRRKSSLTARTAVEREAMELEKQLEDERRFGKKEVEKKEITFRDFYPKFVEAHLEANRLKPSHRMNVKSTFNAHLEPAFGKLALSEIDSRRIAEFVGKLSDRNPKTVNNALTTLKTMLNRAFEWGMMKKPPPKIRPLKVMHEEMEFYDFDIFDRLVEAARKIDPRYVVLTLLGGRAGLRAGEIVGLQWDSVDFARNEIVVRRSNWKGIVHAPKGGRLRRVPMTTDLAAALKEVRHLRGDCVLYQDNGDPATLEAINGWMERIQKRAGMVVNGKLHILRHTFCSHLSMRGASAKAIQDLAGHASITTTMRYMHLSPAAKVEAVALLETRGAIVETGPDARKPA